MICEQLYHGHIIIYTLNWNLHCRSILYDVHLYIAAAKVIGIKYYKMLCNRHLLGVTITCYVVSFVVLGNNCMLRVWLIWA